MIVPEEEAKTKRCQESYPVAGALSQTGHMEAGPMLSPYPGPTLGSYASAVRYTAPYNCIGSDCMAWRWAADIRGGSITDIAVRKGFCGKAGG